MLSTVDTKDNDPHDTVQIVPDVVQLARVAAEFPTLAPDEMKRLDPRAASAAPRPRAETPQIDAPRIDTPGVGSPRVDISSVQLSPRVDTTFRATDVNAALGGRSRNRWMARAAMAFVFALASGVGAAAWQRYGADAQAMMDNYKPSFTLSSLLPSSLLAGKPASAAAPAETAAAAQAPADQETQPAATTAPAVADQPTDTAAPAAPAAAPSPDTAQLIQSMAHDVAALTQQLDDLKAGIAQLKAGQEQLTRELASKAAEAKVAEAREARAEPNPHLKLGAPPHPLGTIVRRAPRPLPPPPAQAAYIPPAAPAPVQIAPPAPQQVPGQPDAAYTRPPMPVQ
jgi:hypothetical protein